KFTIKVPPPLVQKAKPLSQRNYMVHQRDPLHPNIPYPSRMHKQKQQDKDEIQIHNFWQMFKQLHINITLDDALILILKYQKMLKALLLIKEKLLELANTPLNENFSAVILKKLPKKLRDPGKFLISCGFSKLKCKALADLGASINLMPISVWKQLARIARDVFVPVGMFTFPADFVIVDYKSDPRMILHDGDERLTLNMRHDTSSYSNQHQRESINMINIYDDSCEDYLVDLFAKNHLSGNPTCFSLIDLTSPKVKDDIFAPKGDNFLIEKLVNLDSTKDLPPPQVINPLSRNTTSSSPNHLLEEFEMDSILEDLVDECNLANPNVNLVDTILEMFTDEHTLDYASPSIYDDFDDDLFELESSDFFTSLEYDSFLFEDFSEVDALPSTNNEDKVFNPSILIYENLYEDTVQVTPNKNVKKISISHASLILEDFDPPLYDLPFHKEVPDSKTLLSFSSKNEEKYFKPRILTSKGVHTSLLLELSHRVPKAFKFIKNFESPMEIFPCSYGEDIRILDVSCLHFYP
nr:reverse transcriptase domain-containing protein [Tanacetum cinerariifolium]